MKRKSGTRSSGPGAHAGGTYAKSDFSPSSQRSKLHIAHAEDTATSNAPETDGHTADDKQAAERALRSDIARPFKDTGSI
jgi:hypothetical protein